MAERRFGGPACGRAWSRAVGAVVGLAAVWLVSGPVPLAAQAAGSGPAPESGALTVREAVVASLESNQQLADARHGLAAAQAQAREAWGNIMPRANFSMNYTRNLLLPQFFLPARFLDPTAPEGEVVAVETGSENSWYAQVRVDQPLFDGQAFIGVGAAARFEALQQEMLRGRAQQVATSTRLSYYGVLLARERARLTANSLTRVDRVLEETRKLNQAGMASDYDVLRLEVERSNLEPNVRRSEDALASARRALAVEMGVETLDGVELAGSLLTMELPARPVAVSPEAAVDSLLETARERRSDLEQLRLTRELRATERRAELSNYLPRISLFGTWTQQAQHDGAIEFFGGTSFETRAVGVQVDVPLFSGFQRPARLSRMGAVVDQVEAQLGYAEDQAENEVRTLHDQALEAYDRAAAQRRAVEQAERGYEIARREYRAGTGSQLQMTDAELALRQSEFNYAQAVYDYLTAQARLDAAIGAVPLVDVSGDARAFGPSSEGT